MKCSACGRQSSANRKNCMYCGGNLVENKRSGPVHCCGCHTPMNEVDIQGTIIDVCPSCSGIWFDTGELEEVLNKLDSPNDDPHEGGVTAPIQNIPESGSPRNCPHCNLIMGKKNYKRFSGVIVDVCRFHGLYLDGDELEKIHLFMVTGGAKKEQERVEIDEREKQKSAVRAEKRSRLNEVRSSSIRTRYGKMNAETSVYYDFLELVASYLHNIW